MKMAEHENLQKSAWNKRENREKTYKSKVSAATSVGRVGGRV